MEALLPEIAKLGGAVVLVVGLWYAVFTPRKHSDGSPRAPLMVPGWALDAKDREIEAVRTFYEKAQVDRDAEHDRRIHEWRGFRDEERVRRKDAEAQREALLAAVQGLSEDVTTLLDLAQGNGVEPSPRRKTSRG
jgi:hypothetical protein